MNTQIDTYISNAKNVLNNAQKEVIQAQKLSDDLPDNLKEMLVENAKSNLEHAKLNLRNIENIKAGKVGNIQGYAKAVSKSKMDVGVATNTVSRENNEESVSNNNETRMTRSQYRKLHENE